MKYVSHRFAAFFFRWCRGCSFSSTELNCLCSAASKCQRSTCRTGARLSYLITHSLRTYKYKCFHMSGTQLTWEPTEADLMRHVHRNECKAGSKTKVKGKPGLVSALCHQTGVNIFLPLFLHHVTHDRISISPWSFSKIDSNKQKLLRRRTTRKHRYTVFLLPCYMTFFIWECWLILWCMGICRRLCSHRQWRVIKYLQGDISRLHSDTLSPLLFDLCLSNALLSACCDYWSQLHWLSEC